MFAPYCPDCRRRVLLGPRRLVHLDSRGRGRLRAILACFCGRFVEWDASPPAAPAPGSVRPPAQRSGFGDHGPRPRADGDPLTCG